MLKNFTLLYVEDDVDILKKVAFFLEKKCKTLYLAKSADDGLALFKEHHPNLIISDIQMPGTSGLDMVEKIREEDSKVPIIITSAFSESTLLLRAINIGVEGYLLKPINFRKMIKKSEQLLEPLILRNELRKSNEKFRQLNLKLKEKVKKRTMELFTQKERMDFAFTGSNDGLWDWNIMSGEAYLSARWKAIIGYKEYEIQNHVSSWRNSLHPDDLIEVEKALQEVFFKNKKIYQVEFRQKHKNGNYVWVLARGTVRFNDTGKPIRMIGTHTDITKNKEAQAKIEESEYNLKIAQKIAHVGSWKLDIETNNLWWSDEVFRIFGEEVQSFKPTHEHYLSYLTQDNQLLINEAIQKSLAGNSTTFDLTHKIIRKDGSYAYVHEIADINYDANNKKPHMLGVILDVTQQIEFEQELEKQKNFLAYQAYHDMLTELPNRMLFNDRLEQAIHKSKRNHKLFAVFFIDLDNFKEINDSKGHDVGDKVLKIFSKRLKTCVRDEDTIARIGGDEFMVIMENMTQLESASIMAQKVLDILKNPFVISSNTLHVTGSIGISSYPRDGEDTQSLIKNADVAMYTAKKKGKNTYQFNTVSPSLKVPVSIKNGIIN